MMYDPVTDFPKADPDSRVTTYTPGDAIARLAAAHAALGKVPG